VPLNEKWYGTVLFMQVYKMQENIRNSGSVGTPSLNSKILSSNTIKTAVSRIWGFNKAKK
jgi:hypothetical protein